MRLRKLVLIDWCGETHGRNALGRGERAKVDVFDNPSSDPPEEPVAFTLPPRNRRVPLDRVESVGIALAHVEHLHLEFSGRVHDLHGRVDVPVYTLVDAIINVLVHAFVDAVVTT